jgi:DMSO reductase anchor subunit
MLKEWPLVVFTLLGQMAVGVFLCFHVPFLVRGRAPSPGWFVTSLAVLALVAVLVGMAALVSLLHLRHPWRARFVLSNLRTSWLSREILFEILFLGLVVLSGWLAWLRSASPGLEAGLLAAGGLAGALFLVSMIKLYTLPTLPAWRGLYTPVSFLLTTLVLGALATELVVRGVAGPGVFGVALVPVSLALVGLEIVMTALAAPGQGACGRRPGPSLRPVEAAGRSLHELRIGLLAGGLALLGLDLASGANDIMNESGWGAPLVLAFILILAGETAGRLHFYGLVARPGGGPS